MHNVSGGGVRGFVEDLIDQEDDFDRWYVDVVKRSELADDAPVRGCKVVRPYGYALWENMQAALDRRIKATGVQNAYFPMLIPESMLNREAEHIEGFAPEVAWVTHGGNQKLEERLAIRPTSEAIICGMYARWVQSYRDLPILINQWCSVLRWEDRPRAFLRTSEFLWQEGHTCHATAEEAERRALQMLEVYRDFVETELAIPVISGAKSESEKFAGAHRTYTIEAMMGGKFWALQSGTSHDLRDHFGKVFDIEFLDSDGQRKHAFNTSWGLSHRTIGAIVMVHGDDSGLKLPPRVAPIQAVIIPIWRKEDERETVAMHVSRVEQALSGVRIHVDRRDDKTPGWKFNEWELRGVPLRIEVGPRDVHSGQAVVVRRDTREKLAVSLAEMPETVPTLLSQIQSDMFDSAFTRQRERTANVDDLAELYERARTNAGFSLAWWCGDAACEDSVKTESRATIRCLPFDQPAGSGACVVCGRAASMLAVFARAY
ncbi:MAG TPA: proline--tRNA ligase [Thermomicrobiales bacterium]|nr:proline--tRNA ligase [Thermomicrobiales bacterium]